MAKRDVVQTLLKEANALGLDSVEGCFKYFQVASAKVDDIIENGPSSKLGAECRSWHVMAVCLLRAYCEPRNWPDGPEGQPKEKIPLVFAHVIANQLEYVSIGRIPGMMQWSQKRGYEPGPHEKRDIGYAVAYIKAARAGEIIDHSPIKSVAAAYGATPRTVKRWQVTYAFTEPSHFFPDSPSSERGVMLSEAMRKHGERYQLAGRTPDAISRRSRKRRKG